MSNYTFESLNDKEFEILVNDLLARLLSERIERFKPGKDEGVDGRYFTSDGEVIVQSKHWLNTGIQKLLKECRTKELQKVQKLNPSRYLLATSIPLSRKNKTEIKKIFHPFIKSEADIFGQEDLNDLLNQNQNIERKHYKLWISSTNVIQSILSSGIIGRSGFSLEEIKSKSSKYVQTENHQRAQKKLNKNHALIITGNPGIGKTTLAQQLVIDYVGQGFEFIEIEDDLNEALNLYNPETKQVFYYDDFLGRNYLLALKHHQDSQILNFIRRVSQDTKKRFILTSRTNILNQGKWLSDLFEIHHIQKNEYELNIQSLTNMDKAKILYNHIWFGNLSAEFFDEILLDKRYLAIIKHRSFNPRLIEFITDSYRLEKIDKNEYWQYIKETLQEPKNIWQNTIEVQLDYNSRMILIAFVLEGKSISEPQLHEVIDALINQGTLIDKTDFNRTKTLQFLSGSLINRNSRNGSIDYDLFNPSIGDYVIDNCLNNATITSSIIVSLQSSNSIKTLNNLLGSKKISYTLYNETIRQTAEKFVFDSIGNNPYFFIFLTTAVIRAQLTNSQYFKSFEKNIEKEILSVELLRNEDSFDLLILAIKKGLIGNKGNLLGTVEELLDINPGYQILKKVVLLSEEINFPSKLLTKLKEAVLADFEAELTNDINDNGILEEAFEESDISIDTIYEFVEDQLIPFEKLGFTEEEISFLVESVDTYEIIDYNIQSASDNYEDYEFRSKPNSGNTDSEIEDLFS
ncbi:MAG: restriction endonuclease [Flavobacteriaceae bacterium]|nr:restriction endonuclease [Flavobacteriaceae bacterium]